MRASWSTRRLWPGCGVVILVFLAHRAWQWERANLGTLQRGRILRSAQMGASELMETIASRGVKTVLNLRGVNASESWYVAELEATTVAGATQVDFKMASDQWLSRAQ